MKNLDQNKLVYNGVGHGVSFISKLCHTSICANGSVLKIILLLRFKNRHRRKKCYRDIYKAIDDECSNEDDLPLSSTNWTSPIHNKSSHKKYFAIDLLQTLITKRKKSLKVLFK